MTDESKAADQAFEILKAAGNAPAMAEALAMQGITYGTMLAALSVAMHDQNAHAMADMVLEALKIGIHSHIDDMLAGLKPKLH